MQAGKELVKVVALTATPSFITYPGDDTITYNPKNLGEVGYMERVAATAAKTAGDVMFLFESDMAAVEAAIGGELLGKASPVGARSFPPAAGATLAPITATMGAVKGVVTITVAGGPASKAATLTVTGLSAGGKVIAGLTPVAITKNQTSAQVAAAVATMLNGKQDAGKAVSISAIVTGATIAVSEQSSAAIDAGYAVKVV